ncbi:helix-turn-helix domain-containing protein [Photorhabdus khanii]|uniref:Helix-turn-helix domain-containing protein n=1 Tax=Photorhabdus khanii TaxID=1004150 RepID=A0A7C9KCU5_9GAMM|nr:helix-turn-helix transcriptional regulator [Photorhabdus khanii]MQL47882.1 helix-turn-helix domain-containing protein [Photorhabdus khanii]
MSLPVKKTKDNIVKNINYLIKSREESKLSFSEKSGVTRSTVYKILDGKIKNIQKGTVEKVANFFGVSVKLLEEYDIASIEESENNPDGNINPISVPIIKESQLYKKFSRKISQLIVECDNTYCYTHERNIICIKLESDKKPYYLSGEMLFIRRFFKGSDDELLVTIRDKNIEIKGEIILEDLLIGYIIEERTDEKI